MTPPIAARHPHLVVSPHGVRSDDYYWLRDDTRSQPQVLDHLHAENAYTDRWLQRQLIDSQALAQELIARLALDDDSVPSLVRGYWYFSRYRTGLDYPIYLRRRDLADATEEVMLDGNQLALGHEFFTVANYAVSMDNRWLAYAEDVVGRRQYRIRIKDLHTGATLSDLIDNAELHLAWADDHHTLLYVEKDPVLLQGVRVRSHRLGTATSSDVVLYEEADNTFALSVARSRSDHYLLIGARNTLATEWRYARATDPALKFELFLARERHHEYQIEHLPDRWLIRSNWQAPNFRVMEASLERTAQREHWREVVAHDPQAFIHGIEAFTDFLAISERSNVMRRIRIKHWASGHESHLAFDAAAHTTLLAANPDIHAHEVCVTHSSLTKPTETYAIDPRTGMRRLLKREQVCGEFNAEHYVCELLWAPARDGERIPVSVVYRKDMPRDASAPLYLYAYGAYGIATDPAFNVTRLSLLERGFVFGIAHVRGGQELGRRWYDAGRMLAKRNSFTDFIDVTEHLVRQGYAAANKVIAAGGSAGGLLVGAVANLAAEKYRAIVAHVPFVDVVTTMLDESIPVTTLEYDEWGNPQQRIYYDYMLSYSPYDNVRAQAYPAMWVSTGFWDSQVQYYEPAKWVAKLRALKQDRQPLLLRINMQGGHGGKSGRLARYREIAEEYAFILNVVAAEHA